MELQEKKCCICGKKFVGWGNDPWPVNMDEKARCCDKCNSEKVLPARLAQMFGGKNNVERPNS